MPDCHFDRQVISALSLEFAHVECAFTADVYSYQHRQTSSFGVLFRKNVKILSFLLAFPKINNQLGKLPARSCCAALGISTLQLSSRIKLPSHLCLLEEGNEERSIEGVLIAHTSVGCCRVEVWVPRHLQSCNRQRQIRLQAFAGVHIMPHH